MLSKQLKINCSDNNNNIEINTTEFFKEIKVDQQKEIHKKSSKSNSYNFNLYFGQFYEEGLQREIILHRIQEIIL